MPGGTLDFGESLHECALREVKEESGLDIIITDILGTYTNPKIIVAYSDGEVRQEFTVLFKGEVVGDNLVMDGESTSYCWVSLDEVDKLEMTDSQKDRINDVIQFVLFGRKKI